MGNILASLVVKPGFGTYCIDFHVSKSTPRGQIRLFVAQIDNIETSSCIISPQQVNFLLNGKGLEKRTCVLMDPGPQLPTNITAMLICGTNLLQVVGQFNGHYIIAVAFMSTTTLKDAPSLPDYVQPSTASPDPDSDLTEGASRISLNCPISCSRIRIPVKGHLCKHYQCFDFSNFVDINTRRPSWRCPHCNQHICYADIRVDQSMVKVLRDVGESVTSVMISVDGSWRAILEDIEDPLNTRRRKGMSEQQESVTSSSAVPMVVDLTEADDLMDSIDIEDTNLLPPQIADGFWSSLLNGGSLDDLGLDMQMDSGDSDLNLPSTTTSPVLTDAVSPALNRAVDGGTSLASSTHLPNANEYGMLLQLHRNLGNIHRNPVVVQALPAQSLVPQQRSRPTSSTTVGVGNTTGSLSSQQGRHLNTAPGAVLAGRLPTAASGQIHTSRPGASNLASPNGIRTPAMYTRRNIGGAVHATSTSVTDSPLDSSSEQNWRPTGRMRGSLQGQAYSEALRVFMPQPDQHAPAPRPTSLASPVTRPVELQAILSHMRNAPALPVRDTQTTPAASLDGNNP